MMQHLLLLVIYALSVLLASRIVPGFHVRSFGAALLFALVFAILDTVLFPVLVLLALPMVLLTLGLFLFVVHAFVFWLSDKVVPGVEMAGPWSVLGASLVTTVINWGATRVLGVG